MSVTIQINSGDQSDNIDFESLSVEQNLSSLVDTASFMTRKYGSRTLKPAYGDDLKVFDGSSQIFGGTILKVEEIPESGGGGMVYQVEAVDYSYEMDKKLASQTYASQTIKEIITDLLSNYASAFNADNVESGFTIDKIVFNQISVSQCIKQLAEIVQYDWYVDENKSVHFFSKYSKSAPFDLTDTSGNYVYKSLKRTTDGSQVVNRVKVRGGEYNGDAFTDSITVSGNDSKSFKLPYKMANLTVSVNSVSKTVGIDFIDDFTAKDVLYNYQDYTIRFENALTDGDVIEFSGNPKVRVFAISEEPSSVASYDQIEKLIRDDNIKDNAVARRRAAAELYAYQEPIIDAKFYTYNSGLRTGMLINLDSARRDCDDDLLIKKIAFRMIDPDTFGYAVECVSTKRYGLVELLQKMLQPEQPDTEESEVSEEIFTDTADVNIAEEHEVVSPQEDYATITIEESISLNPFPPANIVWVWGYYFPTSESDVKRMARWGRDATWQ